MMFSYSLSFPLLSFHLRYITDASTLAGLDVFGSFSKLTWERLSEMTSVLHRLEFLPLKGVLCGRSGWDSTFHKAARQTGGRPPGGAGWIHTGRHSAQCQGFFFFKGIFQDVNHLVDIWMPDFWEKPNRGRVVRVVRGKLQVCLWNNWIVIFMFIIQNHFDNIKWHGKR